MNLGFKVGDKVKFSYSTSTSFNVCIGEITQIESVERTIIDCYNIGLYDIKDVRDKVHAIIKVRVYDGTFKNCRIKLSELTLVPANAKINYKIEEEKNMTNGYKFPTIQPVIIDYKVFNNKVVVVWFDDGTTEKATCDDLDVFNLERAIEVCVVKKKFGGSNEYNKAIKKAMKQIAAIDKKKKIEKEEQELLAKKKEKEIARKIKRREKKRQEQVDMMTEAYLKAMLAYDEEVLRSLEEAEN